MRVKLAPVQCVLIAVCLMIAIITPYYSNTDFTAFTLRGNSSSRMPVQFPLTMPSNSEAETFELDGDMSTGWLAATTYRIIPDDRLDSLTVNGAPVDLSGVPSESLQDFNTGFQLDLAPYVHHGRNHIKFQFWDRGGHGFMGIKMRPSVFSLGNFLAIVMGALSVGLIAHLFAHLVTVSKRQLVLYSLIVIGLLIRVACIVAYNPVDHIWSDPQRHWEQGIDALRIELMSMTDPILYQLYIGCLAKLSLKIPSLVAFYTSILSVLTPWLWYRFMRELQGSKTLALAGFAALALLPSWVSIYSYFMQETVLLPLLGGALWMTWRAKRKADLSSFLWMVCWWILAGLTRGIAIPLAAVCCTWLWVSQPVKLKRALASVAILLLTLGPLGVRSEHAVHEFAPNGMGHLAAIYGISGKREIILNTRREGASWTHAFGSPSTGATPFAPFSDWHTRRAGAEVVNVDFDAGARDWSKAYVNAKNNFNDHGWIIAENLVFLFFTPSWPDNNAARILDEINIEMRWVWAPAFLIVMLLLLLARKKMRGNWLLTSLLAVWFLVQGLLPIAVNEGRYRKPFEGLLIAQMVLLAAAFCGQAPTSNTTMHWAALFDRLRRSKPAEYPKN